MGAAAPKTNLQRYMSSCHNVTIPASSGFTYKLFETLPSQEKWEVFFAGSDVR